MDIRYHLSLKVVQSPCKNDGRHDPTDPDCQPRDAHKILNMDLAVRKNEDFCFARQLFNWALICHCSAGAGTALDASKLAGLELHVAESLGCGTCVTAAHDVMGAPCISGQRVLHVQMGVSCLVRLWCHKNMSHRFQIIASVQYGENRSSVRLSCAWDVCNRFLRTCSFAKLRTVLALSKNANSAQGHCLSFFWFHIFLDS